MRKGYFGDFGGCFVPELLMPPLMELEKAMADILPSEDFQKELQKLLMTLQKLQSGFCEKLSC